MTASSDTLVRAVLAPALAALLAGAAELAAQGSAERRAVPPPPSPRQEFARICEVLRDSELSWYGSGVARRLEAQLAAGVDGRTPVEEASLRTRLGTELLMLGKPGEAIAQLDHALKLAQEAEAAPVDRQQVLWQLGLAHLQLAEDENCVERHNEASCILPIRPEGVHSRPEAARRAGSYFLRLLQERPRDLQAAWLLNLSAMLAGVYPQAVPDPLRPPAEAFAPEGDFPLWIDRAAELGVDVFDLAGGAVMDDFDGDGLLDLVTSTWDPCGSLKAFRNDGAGGFENVTELWGLDGQLGGLNLVHADYDGDGRLDLLVLRGGWMFVNGRIRNSLLHNEIGRDGGGGFVDVTRRAGLAEPAYPTQAGVWADYDGDGDLDLFVANESTADFEPYPSQLYRNDGDGTFTDVAPAAGVTNDRYAKGAAWGDYDDDGDPDLYVSNIGVNRLYRNDGDGTFTDVAPALGVTRPEDRSFVPWFFDHDNDGDLDLWVNHYGAPLAWVTGSIYGLEVPGGAPLLYRNDGGRFTALAPSESGLARATLPMGSNYGDLDNDGWLDVYLGTGDPRYEAVMPNLALRNRSGRFEEVTFASGLGHLQKGHGVAFGDLDNDGDQDLFHQLGGFYPGDAFTNALFENPGSPADGPGRRWITLRLEGRRANRSGVGARIEIRVRRGEERRSVHVVAGSGGSFGGSSLQQEIGLGEADAIEEVVIRWPGSGRIDRHRAVAPDRFYRAVEGAEALEPVEAPRLELGAAPAPAAPHHHSDEPPTPAKEPADDG